MPTDAELQLRSLIDDRKKVFIDEIKQLPRSKRDFYFDLIDRAWKEISIEKSLGRINL